MRLWLREEPGRVLCGARIRYAPFSSVTDGDWKVYAVDMRVPNDALFVPVEFKGSLSDLNIHISK